MSDSQENNYENTTRQKINTVGKPRKEEYIADVAVAVGGAYIINIV